MGKFRHVVAAGSWDHLHAGHKQFLQVAFETGEKVSVGITSEKMITNKLFARSLESFEQRKQTVTDYVQLKGWLDRAIFNKLDDIYGPALTDASIDALIVTAKTRGGGEKVNQARTEQGLLVLQLIEVPLALASDGKEVSSERVRMGEINREGLVYLDFFRRQPVLRLPDALRWVFQKPFGELLVGSGQAMAEKIRRKLKDTLPARVMCVGDVVTKLCIDFGILADLFVVDLMVEREKKYANLGELGLVDSFVTVKNPAGVITRELAEKITVEKIILVEGEEDLAVLPAVLTAPLGAAILYGQPKEGVVWVEVTEEKKAEAYDLLKQFD